MTGRFPFFRREQARGSDQPVGGAGRPMGEVQAEKDVLAAVLATMSDGVVATDGGGRIILANPAAERLLDAELRPGHRLIDQVRDYEMHRLLRDCVSAGQVQREEFQAARSRRFLDATGTALAGREPGGALLVLRDVTELRRVDRTRREFVANVSHELRTPLTVVKAAVDTLRDGALEDREAALRLLGQMEEEVDRMTGLVSDLLELSRLESGQVRPVLVEVDLTPLLHEAAGRMQTRAMAKGITLEVALRDALPSLLADPKLISEVLANLLDNAIKFTPPGGEVTLEAEASSEWVTVSVRDTGPGIAPEHLPHLFERFYKADRAHQGGTGLGLAIVKHIVQAHGGEVEVSSQEETGSTFRFTLPVPSAGS